MEVFGLTRYLFVLISACYPPKGTSNSIRCFYWCYSIFFCIVHVLGFWAGVQFGLHAFFLGDIEGTLNATSQLAGCANTTYTSFAGIYFRGHFTRTFDRYVELHKKGDNLSALCHPFYSLYFEPV